VSKEKFDENCEGCRPAIIDMKTMKVQPQDSPMMKIANACFDKLTREEKAAWHRVACQNSSDLNDMAIAIKYSRMLNEALSEKVTH
jgi:hypothetical protein